MFLCVLCGLRFVHHRGHREEHEICTSNQSPSRRISDSRFRHSLAESQPRPRAARGARVDARLLRSVGTSHQRRRLGHELVGDVRASSAIASRRFSAATPARCRFNRMRRLRCPACFRVLISNRASETRSSPARSIFRRCSTSGTRKRRWARASKSFSQMTASRFRWRNFGRD